MAEPFATVGDLTARGFTVDQDEQQLADTHLADASEYLRGEIGWQVYPPATIKTTTPGWVSSIHLPGAPIRSIVSVQAEPASGQLLDVPPITYLPVDYRFVDNVLHLIRRGRNVTVTYEVGYANPPAELVSWTCVLAADSISKARLGLLGAAPASMAIDDFRVNYSAQQQAGASPVPDRVLERLRRTYGAGGAFVT